MQKAEGRGPDNARHERLAELKVELDRCWDLLRQREAREEFQLDPGEASARADAEHARGLRAVGGAKRDWQNHAARRSCSTTRGCGAAR